MSWRGVPAGDQTVSWLLPAALAILYSYETPRSQIAFQFGSLLLILAAYWQMAWLAQGFWPDWEARFQSWDVRLLHSLPAVPFAFGWFVAAWVQLCYSLLYVAPPVYLGAIYWSGAGRRAGYYLFTLFLGILAADLILPHIPVRPPRIAFPDELHPAIVTAMGRWNLWVLDHVDISTSVFPSGHVAVAFSGAFGLLRALPKRRDLWLGAVLFAISVWAATIYSRFHYAADGAASLLVSLAAWRVSEIWVPASEEAA